MQDTFVISASASSEEDKKSSQKNGYKSFERQCTDALPSKVGQKKKMVILHGGMQRLMS
jgi:hypothetical protein